MVEKKRRVYHVGEQGKEIIEYPNGEISHSRLTKAERDEWKDKRYFDIELEKFDAKNPDPRRRNHIIDYPYDLQIDWIALKKMCRANKWKGHDLVNHVNDYIRQTWLMYRG